jgi:hypothetical protein
MLRSMKDLENYAIGATDGEVGHAYWLASPLLELAA